MLDGEGGEVIYKRSLKEGEGPMETEATDALQLNRLKRAYPAVAQTSTGTRQATPWNDANCTPIDSGRASKKSKAVVSEIYGSNSSSCASSLDGLFAPPLVHANGKPLETCDETDNPEKSVTSEMHFFPVDNSATWKSQPLAEEDRHPDGTPNLELALGAEAKPAEQEILPFFVGMVDQKNKAIKEDMEDATASLSLSLAFPFSDKERTSKKPVSKTTEQRLPERRRHVNTSLLLFGGFPDG